ncbi:MAG TPA: Clp protease N-terminal domain-containing protein, partial [Pseudonocardiaceae bacterium]|nr:Clp protease N-terminal domain-containing protein [Pseudonocardiaceae bacterium]
MPKINVYLSDELAEAVKELGLPVSPICQQALESAVRQVQSIETTGKLDLTADDPTAKLTRFTVKARTAVNLAIQRARVSGVPRITTEHLLLGLLDEGTNLSLEVLRSLEIEPDDLREDLAARPPAADNEPVDGHEIGGRQLDPSTTEALKLALRTALSFAHNYIGGEHLLLGLINEETGGAGEILRARGAEPKLARRALAATLSGYAYARNRIESGGGDQAKALVAALAKIGERLDRLERRVGLNE